MKVFTPEISWHQKEPIFSVDFCNSTWKLASAGADFTIKVWDFSTFCGIESQMPHTAFVYVDYFISNISIFLALAYLSS